MSDARSAPLLVDCPTCARRTPYDASNPWRPFCSQRCRTVDLGAWASGSYVIAGSPADPPGEPFRQE
jgi:endogenous inhibitor of DNA gyrase (YacG/DUF329 family)